MQPNQIPTYVELKHMCVRILNEVNGPGFGLIRSILDELNQYGICSHERSAHVREEYEKVFGTDWKKKD